MSEHASIHNVRVRTSSKVVSLPWESAQDFVRRALVAYPSVHPVVEQFRARGVSRPVELDDANDRTFVLAVIEGWAAQGELPSGDHRASWRAPLEALRRIPTCQST